jgi:hypothetical protein
MNEGHEEKGYKRAAAEKRVIGIFRNTFERGESTGIQKQMSAKEKTKSPLRPSAVSGPVKTMIGVVGTSESAKVKRQGSRRLVELVPGFGKSVILRSSPVEDVGVKW